MAPGERYQRLMKLLEREIASMLAQHNARIRGHDDEREAVLLANVCASLASAQGVHLAQHGDRSTFYALFDGQPGEAARAPDRGSGPQAPAPSSPHDERESMLRVDEPIPEVGATRKPIMSMPPTAMGPLPPVRPPPPPAIPGVASPAPASPPVVKEPPRELVMPLAKLALASVVTKLPGFQQALITLNLQVHEGGRARFFVVVVASDVEGNLMAVPTPEGLMEAARDLIAEDARRGNGRWRRMTARLKNKPTGISVRVEVVP